jgi:hypothetical protein
MVNPHLSEQLDCPAVSCIPGAGQGTQILGVGSLAATFLLASTQLTRVPVHGERVGSLLSACSCLYCLVPVSRLAHEPVAPRWEACGACGFWTNLGRDDTAPCPLCGSEVVVTEHHDFESWAQCDDCGKWWAISRCQVCATPVQAAGGGVWGHPAWFALSQCPLSALRGGWHAQARGKVTRALTSSRLSRRNVPDETARRLERAGDGARWNCSMLRKGGAKSWQKAWGPRTRFTSPGATCPPKRCA